MPVADEVFELQVLESNEGEIFRAAAAQGVLAGRGDAVLTTRQGIYALTPGGRYLGSIHTRDPRQVESMLADALSEWRALPESERTTPAPTDDKARGRDLWPENGVALKVSWRDLPRSKALSSNWRDVPRNEVMSSKRTERRVMNPHWNLDFAWFRPNELESLVPTSIALGASATLCEDVLRRLARLHFVDGAGGQALSFEDREVRKVDLVGTIIAIDDERIELVIEGSVHSVQRQRRTKDRTPGAAGVPLLVKSWKYPRGIVLEILGSARWNRVEKHFDAFELVAIGTRFGGSHFVGRFNDPGPSPIGLLFTLDSSGERIPPANLWAYGW